MVKSTISLELCILLIELMHIWVSFKMDKTSLCRAILYLGPRPQPDSLLCVNIMLGCPNN